MGLKILGAICIGSSPISPTNNLEIYNEGFSMSKHCVCDKFKLNNRIKKPATRLQYPPRPEKITKDYCEMK